MGLIELELEISRTHQEQDEWEQMQSSVRLERQPWSDA
jgi:hypothetical protein